MDGRDNRERIDLIRTLKIITYLTRQITRINPLVVGVEVWFYPQTWGSMPTIRGTAYFLRCVGVKKSATLGKPERFDVQQIQHDIALPPEVYTKPKIRMQFIEAATQALHNCLGIEPKGITIGKFMIGST